MGKSTEEIRKELQMTDEILALIENQMTDDAMATSDLQGVAQAIIMKAIAYGKTLK